MSVDVPPAVRKQLERVRRKLDTIPILQKAEDATNVPKEYLVLILGFVGLLLMFFGIGAGSLCSIVGFIYPAFKSFESIENRAKSDQTQWLIYWVVYAFFSIIEVFVDVLLYWIPFYYAFKMAFLLWAMLPQTKGAKYLYDSFLKDFLKKNESKIDAALSHAQKTANNIVSEATAAADEVKSAGINAAKEMVNNNTDKSD
jgi:receptor expression-enhancing protein 5/6